MYYVSVFCSLNCVMGISTSATRRSKLKKLRKEDSTWQRWKKGGNRAERNSKKSKTVRRCRKVFLKWKPKPDIILEAEIGHLERENYINICYYNQNIDPLDGPSSLQHISWYVLWYMYSGREKLTVHTVHVLCIYCACTVHMLCMYCTHTVHVLCIYCACTVHILCMYCATYCAYTVQ
jgi:hypothetical protein